MTINPTDRRDSARHMTSWAGRLPNGQGRLRVLDASESGLFLAVQPAPPVGTTLIIEVVVGGKAVMVTGDVVRHVTVPPGAPMPSGVGLRLTRKPPGWKELVGQLGERNRDVPSSPQTGIRDRSM